MGSGETEAVGCRTVQKIKHKRAHVVKVEGLS